MVSDDDDPAVIASDPARSAWVSANAGSGKTYTLANRVTRLLLAGAPSEKILCLTYTKAAAAEMQHRLFSVLGSLAMLPEMELTARLSEITGEEIADIDLAAARRIFALALETPGGLRIQTIHAFCQNVLSRFPLEADVTPGFRVLDEQTATSLMNDARDRVLERAGGGDAALYSALSKIVTQMSETRMSEILRVALSTDRRKLERFFDTLGPASDALEIAMRQSHGVQGSDTEDSVVTAFCARVAQDSARFLRMIEWLDRGSKSDREKATRLRDALDRSTPATKFQGFARALLKKDGQKPQSLASNALSRGVEREYLTELVESLCEAESRRRAAFAAELCHAILVIARAVLETYTRSKLARGALDYDDLIAKTRRLIERADAAQWVLFKLDGGLDHILIDEAQDTSPEQWAIVSKLCEEFFAGQGADPDRFRTIFAVGDEKQSIFSFQGADPSQFEAFRTYFGERVLAAELDFVSTPLLSSRRSAPEILEFVDRVFSDPEACDGLGSEPVLHRAYRESAKGRVEFWPALAPTDAPDPDPWREVDLPSISSPVSTLARRIADEIKQWLDGRLRLPSRDRAVEPGDIMILLPKREPFGTPIISALKQRGIPVSGADRMCLTDQLAVMDLIALARFALLPEDDLTTATLLRTPMLDIDEAGLFRICHGRSASVWRELSQRREETPEFASAHAFLSDVLGKADYLPPFEFFATVLSAHRARFLARLGAEATDAIEEFLSLALRFEAENTPSLDGFLDWILRGGSEIKRDMERERGEVRVMTVHGAKGLEADIVILPDTTTLPQTPSQKGHLLYRRDGIVFPVTEVLQAASVGVAKQDAMDDVLREHRRLLYVALTRARDRLYICGAANKLGIRKGSWYRLAEKAATSMGAEVPCFGEKIWRIGDGGDLHGASAPQPKSAAPLPAWVGMPAPREETQKSIQPSEVMRTEAGAYRRHAIAKPSDMNRGTLIHTLLARLPEIANKDRVSIATRYLLDQGVAADAVPALVAEILAVLNHDAFAAAFAPGSRAEISIAADLPEIGTGARIEGRIDRLAVQNSEVLVVDFKSDREPSEREQDVSPTYLAQMACYRAAIQKIWPERHVSCALVWTAAPSLMRLSDALLDSEIATLRSSLDRQNLTT